MLTKVKRFIEQYHMLELKDRIVIGVSGGADSMCLLTILMQLSKEYQLELFVVHVNHGIRGTEADEEEAYVREFCSQHHISFTAHKVEVGRVAEMTGQSIEEAGRNVRYHIFSKEYKRKHANKIAVAHNMNDNAETVLFHLFRGTGLTGLTGIAPCRNSLIRPLLCVERGEIEQYMAQHDVAYCTDSSNASLAYARNRIRRDILPYASKHLNEQAVSHIFSVSQQLKEAEEYLHHMTQERMKDIVTEGDEGSFLSIEGLQSQPLALQKSIIRETIMKCCNNRRDITEAHVLFVLALCDKGVGRCISLPYHMVAKRTYTDIHLFQCEKREKQAKREEANSFTIMRREDQLGHVSERIESEHYAGKENQKKKLLDKEPREFSVQIPGHIEIPEKGIVLLFSISENKKMPKIEQNGYTKCFDYDKIKNTVTIRYRKAGDYLQINPIGGRKLIKNYFIDRKIAREQRDEIPLLCDGSHVLWILGDRTSEAYRVDNNTNKVLWVEMVQCTKKDEKEVSCNGGRS